MAFQLPPGARLNNPVFELIKDSVFGPQEFAATSGMLPRALAFFGQSTVSTIYRQGDENPWGRFVPAAQAAFFTPLGNIGSLFGPSPIPGGAQQQSVQPPQKFDTQLFGPQQFGPTTQQQFVQGGGNFVQPQAQMSLQDAFRLGQQSMQQMSQPQVAPMSTGFGFGF